jgi:hypothetical protein
MQYFVIYTLLAIGHTDKQLTTCRVSLGASVGTDVGVTVSVPDALAAMFRCVIAVPTQVTVVLIVPVSAQMSRDHWPLMSR